MADERILVRVTGWIWGIHTKLMDFKIRLRNFYSKIFDLSKNKTGKSNQFFLIIFHLTPSTHLTNQKLFKKAV